MLTRVNKPLIYLAGKIAKNDWRVQIFGERFGAAPYDEHNGFDHLLDETYTQDMDLFVYGGPFFISCDHGCAHGPATHGAGPNNCTGPADDKAAEIKRKIWHVNCARISRADYVFAYINETDCFGTLVELGYAAALGKKISIGIGRNIKVEEFNDLWMAYQCTSDGGVWTGDSAREIFERWWRYRDGRGHGRTGQVVTLRP